MDKYNSTEEYIQQLLTTISNNDKYNGCVFHGPGIYFVIGNGSLWEISDDASCSPRGGWFPDIVSGPTLEENKYLEEMMKKYDIDEYFFSELIDDCGEFDDEYVLEYFEDNEDVESAKIYRKMKKQIESGKTPFETIDDFVSALGRYGLESNCLYYEWEGEYIDLHDNICHTGEARGSYDSMSNEEWVTLLENIDDHIVKR